MISVRRVFFSAVGRESNLERGLEREREREKETEKDY